MVPLGCLPSAISGSTRECVRESSKLAELHNKAISSVLQKLGHQLKGSRYSHINIYTIHNDIINHPSKYGFEEGITCCVFGPYRIVYSCGEVRGVKEYELCDNPSKNMCSLIQPIKLKGPTTTC